MAVAAIPPPEPAAPARVVVEQVGLAHGGLEAAVPLLPAGRPVRVAVGQPAPAAPSAPPVAVEDEVLAPGRPQPRSASLVGLEFDLDPILVSISQIQGVSSALIVGLG